MITSYTCEDWKGEFTQAAKRKLDGEDNIEIEKILKKMSPCSDWVTQKTMMDIIEKNKKIQHYPKPYLQKESNYSYSSR